MGERPRALPRARPETGRPAGARRALALGHHGRRARPHLQPAPAHPPRPGRLRAALLRHRASPSSRETALALAQKYRDPSATARTFALALCARPERPAAPRHLEGGGPPLRAPCVAGALRRWLAPGEPGAGRRNGLGQAGLWPSRHFRRPAHPARACRRRRDLALVRQVLQAQEYWRLKGLSADVVILNEHPVRYLDEIHAQLTALLDKGPGGRGNTDRAAPTCCAATGCPRRRPARDRGAGGAQRGSGRPRATNSTDRYRWPRAGSGVSASAPASAGVAGHRRTPGLPSLHRNGLGGFTDDAREYAIVLQGARKPRCHG